MPEEVSYDPETRLFRAYARGRDTIEDWNVFKAKVLELYAQSGTGRLLWNTEEQISTPSIMEIYSFATEWPTGIRLAILPSETTIGELRFLETVAVNRSGRVRLFSSEKDALEWLMQ